MVRMLFAAGLAIAGAAALSPAAAAPADKDKDKEDGRGYRVVGDYTSVYGYEPLRVEAIGLVVGLQGTGGDPPPGIYRDGVLKLMRNHDVEAPEKRLASKTMAAVIIRGVVPPGARKGDMIDADVFVCPNDNETTSLRGGYLLPVSLGERVFVGGQLRPGTDLVTVEGPVLLKDPVSKKDENAAKLGSVLGRGKVLKDRDFIIAINKDSRSSRLAKEIQTAINGRFFANADKTGEAKGIAKATDKTQIQVIVPAQYRHNVTRFLHVCRRVPFVVPDSARTAMIRDLKQSLMDPGKAYDAALRFEALGLLAVTPLKEAMGSPSQIVRFSAAESLAYLGDGHGLKELTALAETDSLYRPYAIAAIASLRIPQAQLMLTKLLHAPGAETRYGAFRALWLNDHNDPLVLGEKLADDCTLHVITSNAEPMVHVASHFRPEIVVFGKNQKLMPPVLLRVADHLIVQHEGNGEKIIVTSIRPGKQPIREESSPDVAEVIRKAAKVGAKYPDLVELLRAAAATGCLQSRLEINALPRAASIKEIAQGNENDIQQLPSGLPSMFQDGVAPPEERHHAEPETVKKEEPKKKKLWWPFSLLVN